MHASCAYVFPVTFPLFSFTHWHSLLHSFAMSHGISCVQRRSGPALHFATSLALIATSAVRLRIHSAAFAVWSAAHPPSPSDAHASHAWRAALECSVHPCVLTRPFSWRAAIARSAPRSRPRPTHRLALASRTRTSSAHLRSAIVVALAAPGSYVRIPVHLPRGLRHPRQELPAILLIAFKAREPGRLPDSRGTWLS